MMHRKQEETDGVEERPALDPHSRPHSKHPLRLAYFSPLPPVHSGIADYSREILPHLAQHASLTLFTNDPQAVDPTLQAEFDIQSVAAYAAQRWQFDLPVYQMGNSTHHEELYDVMYRYPGILVLHDYMLHHFMAQHTFGRYTFIGYARELAYARGLAGVEEASALYRREAKIRLNELSLNNRAIDLNLGTLVHSKYVQQQIVTKHPRSAVYVVPAPIAPYKGSPCREQLPWSPEAFIFASFGQITAGKQMDRILRVFRQLRQKQPMARYLIVGEALPEVNLETLIEELELEDDVYATGYVDNLQTFANWLVTADVVVNLRHPTLGETSAAALRAMVAGRPLVVYDHGWYGELPDGVAVKVPPLDDEALLSSLESLSKDQERRRTLGRKASDYALSEHAPAQTAAAYIRAIERILDRTRGQRV